MIKFFDFLEDESGAVTVDWVVLTAAVVGMGIVIILYIRPAVSSLASEIGLELQQAQSCLESGAVTCN